MWSRLQAVVVHIRRDVESFTRRVTEDNMRGNTQDRTPRRVMVSILLTVYIMSSGVLVDDTAVTPIPRAAICGMGEEALLNGAVVPDLVLVCMDSLLEVVARIDEY